MIFSSTSVGGRRPHHAAASDVAEDPMAARRPPKALPATIYWFALPRRFHDESVRRYGFHGLSYEHIASVLPEAAPEIAEGRVVVAHLGSGERSPEIRERACERAAWFGIELDHAANRAGGPRISTDGSRVAAYVVPTDEEQMIARHTLATPCRAPTDGAA